MNRIPTYALYGEDERPPVQETLHCESIAQRSRVYDWEIRPHRHELFAQILHIRHGSVEAVVEERTWSMQGPCVLFMPALVAHGFRFSSDVDGSVFTVVAHQLKARLAAAPELLGHFAIPQHHRFDAGSADAGRIDAALETLLCEFNGNGPWRAAAIEAALTLSLLRIGRAFAGASAGEEEGATSRRLHHVQRFLALVDVDFREQRSIAAYASPLGITPTQLNRVCRQVLGRSALSAVHARLLLEAERDLAYTSLSVKEIALSLGFADAAYFTRFFLRQRGTSPSGFRQVARQHLAGITQ